MPNAAIKQERGHNRFGRSVRGKYLACDHGRGFAPFQCVPLGGVVLAEIGAVRARQDTADTLTGTFEEIP